MLQPVEPTGSDPYAECRNAIEVLTAAEATHNGFIKQVAAAAKSLDQAIAIFKESSVRLVKSLGDEAEPQFAASIPEFDTVAFRRWLCAKLGAL